MLRYFDLAAQPTFWASAFLVSVPVFVQAPLVRHAPWISLFLTLAWLGLSWKLYAHPQTRWWGSLLFGFTLTWCAGSLYWGWLRQEPLWHLPVEALGLPLAWWGLRTGWAVVGNFFYLGSLLGTAITDLYIHSVGLLSEWREVMQLAEMQQGQVAFQSALLKMQTLWGGLWAVELSLILLVIGIWSLHRSVGEPKYRLSWLAFAGAALSTLVVDALFGISAILIAQ